MFVGCGSLKKCVWEKSTADFAFVAETRTDYLNTMIERNSNLQIFILHLYFFKDFTNPLRRANWYTYLLTVDSKHIYPKRRANLTCTEVSPKVYGRIWVVLKISTFWFSYFNSGLFPGLYNIFFLHHARFFDPKKPCKLDRIREKVSLVTLWARHWVLNYIVINVFIT